MTDLIRTFKELTAEERPLAGGKGGTLAWLYQAGYRVPDGFVILPRAFEGDRLALAAWAQVQAQLQRLRQEDPGGAFAVRSSALSEDSAAASFAGEFETVLDVHSDEVVREAIRTVRRSRHSERVRAYSEAKGIDAVHEMAVVVQRLVRADLSGVLFTADPVTGNRNEMMGNYVYGFGEELVSGEAEPYTVTFKRPRGRYEGPSELKRYAGRLYRLATRLERDLDCPQDIEWAVADGQLYLLQSRPITTLITHNPATGEWNDTLGGDCLWSSQLTGEVYCEVMTPSTWSAWEIIFDRMGMGDIRTIGNICGRPYLSVSAMYSFLNMLMPREKVLGYLESVGGVPEGMDIPVVPVSLRTLLVDVLAVQLRIEWEKRQLDRKRTEFIAQARERCEDLQWRIRKTVDPTEIIALWEGEIRPLFISLHALQDVSNEQSFHYLAALRAALVKLLGEVEAGEFMSAISASAEHLVSLGPLLDIARVARGEMTPEAYTAHYGHRGPYENYLEAPRPEEDPGWLDRRLEEYHSSPVNVEVLLEKRRAEFDARWRRFQERYPAKARSVRRKIDGWTRASRDREAVRTELTRAVGVIRVLFLRAGELTGLGEDVFFLTLQELLGILADDDAPLATIAPRRETHARYKALPPLPSYIRGRFDPFQWVADPNRRSDIFDAYAPIPLTEPEVITGNAGSAGRVEGVVRRIDRVEEGDQLQPGEILVTVTTNVGWTSLFPRAAAIVTDVGAQLSHAAIVARELGIPAVVGCGNATMRLRTGDRVRVDGGRGTVEALESISK